MTTFSYFFALPAGFVAATALFQVGDIVAPPMIEGQGEYAEPVAAGEIVLVDWTIEKRTDCPGYTGRVWEGDHGFQLSEPVQATALPEGRGEYRIPTNIPALAPAGELRLSIRGHFDCEGDAPRYFEIGPVVFEVVK